MSKLSNPGFVTEILERHGIRLKKKWGQNFLVDENILHKVVSAAQVAAGDRVLEIGPGIGALTQKLAHIASYVISIEIDGRLLPVLKDTLREYDNVEIIHQDAMDVDYGSLCRPGPLKLVANLPYNVATPLFYRWLKEYRHCFSALVCMLQKEVAQRVVALPGSKEYGTLSVICQFAADAEIVFDVPRTVFFPRPDVSSAVVRLMPVPRGRFDAGSEPLFFKIVEALFAQRRKTALNSLHSAFDVSKEELAAVGAAAGIDLTRRGETLSVQEFANLTRVVYNKFGSI